MSKEKCSNNSSLQSITLLSEEDAKKYAGQFVCVEHFNSKHVVSADKDPVLAHRAAQQKGFANPVLFYNPRTDEIFIFSCMAHTQESMSMHI